MACRYARKHYQLASVTTACRHALDELKVVASSYAAAQDDAPHTLYFAVADFETAQQVFATVRHSSGLRQRVSHSAQHGFRNVPYVAWIPATKKRSAPSGLTPHPSENLIAPDDEAGLGADTIAELIASRSAKKYDVRDDVSTSTYRKLSHIRFRDMNVHLRDVS